jgi:hypothetical protein
LLGGISIVSEGGYRCLEGYGAQRRDIIKNDERTSSRPIRIAVDAGATREKRSLTSAWLESLHTPKLPLDRSTRIPHVWSSQLCGFFQGS